MNMLKKTFLVILLFMPTLVFSDIPPGKWLCNSFDNKHKSYEGLGSSVKKAMQNAKQNCLEHAKYKNSCKTAQSYCQQGPLSLLEDRCVVTDTNGRTWNATGPKACDIGLSLCRRWQFLHGKTSPCSIKHF